MLNKDQRSFIMSLLLGDGCLHYTSNRVSGAITLDHGLAQADYISWKRDLLSAITKRDIKVRSGHNGKSLQLSVAMKKFKAWRKFCYPGDKKQIKKILPFIRHPEFAIAVWLCDDGYAESSFSTLATGEKKNYGARLRIYTCSETLEDHKDIISWFESNFGVSPKIKTQKKGKKNYPFLKFTQTESLLLWEKIREFVLQFKSMQYKFRYMESIYQVKLAQRVPEDKSSDDIVRSSTNT